MKKLKDLIAIIGVGVVGLIILNYSTDIFQEQKIIINECPSPIIEQQVVEKVELENGWICDKPKMDTDLLQPSGYWIGSTISCWKLETPIEEYNIKMCIKTKADYFCNPSKI